METKEITKRPPNGQMEMTEPRKLPTLADLITEDEGTIKQNALMVLLNQPPHESWIKEHPTAKVKVNGQMVPMPYMPAARIEFLLSRIFTRWWVEVKSVQVIANSCVAIVRVYVINPITKQEEWNDGVGACPIQTDAGASATDFSKVKNAGVQMAAPAAETYAFKDACEKWGKIFGKDLSRQDELNYTQLLKNTRVVTLSDLQTLYDLKKDSMSRADIKDAERIINDKEEKSYYKLQQKLMSL